MRSTHYFFALTIPENVKDLLASICEQLKHNCPFKNWVHHDDYHITLAFLGNADQSRLTDAVTNVKQALKAVEPFEVSLNRAGTFGRPDLPRILWINTTESSTLSVVRNKVYASCEKAGFELETRPFKPHITLARKWTGEGKFDLSSVQESIGSLLQGPAFSMEEAALYRTHLDRTPKYEKVESFKFL